MARCHFDLRRDARGVGRLADALSEGVIRDEQFLKPLLELFPASAAHESNLTGPGFVTVPRFWTHAFPEADFAYVPWGEDGPNRNGKMMRFWQLPVSGSARRALIAGRLFSEKVFPPIRSVAVPEEGVALPDERHDPVPPMYTDDELAVLRSRERRPFADQRSHPGARRPA